jgi:hypothetical protein
MKTKIILTYNSVLNPTSSYKYPLSKGAGMLIIWGKVASFAKTVALSSLFTLVRTIEVAAGIPNE